MSHPKDGLVINLYIPHNRRMALQAEEALGPISIPLGCLRSMKFWNTIDQLICTCTIGYSVDTSTYDNQQSEKISWGTCTVDTGGILFPNHGPHKGIKSTIIQRKNHNYIEYSYTMTYLSQHITCLPWHLSTYKNVDQHNFSSTLLVYHQFRTQYTFVYIKNMHTCNIVDYIFM